MDPDAPPILTPTWQGLVRAKRTAKWVKYGVFATAVSPHYRPASTGSLLYVGKSLGPKAAQLELCEDQNDSAQKTAAWMLQRRYWSPFWKFVEAIDSSQRNIAWTNVSKMDRADGNKPTEEDFHQIAEACMDALSDEIRALKPRLTLFVTGPDYRKHIAALLDRLGYRCHALQAPVSRASCYITPEGRFALVTRHPGGWRGRRDSLQRQQVIDAARRLLNDSRTADAE